MYEAGQCILYGKTGVCRVEGTVEQPVPGRKEPRLYYVLRPLYQSGSIMAPVDNVDSGKVLTRPIMSRTEARAFIKAMPSLEAEPYYNQNLGRLRDHYREQLGTLTGRELALLIRSIYLKKQQAAADKRKLGAVDQQFMDEAEGLLYGELAAALGLERGQVRDYIDKTLQDG